MYNEAQSAEGDTLITDQDAVINESNKLSGGNNCHKLAQRSSESQHMTRQRERILVIAQEMLALMIAALRLVRVLLGIIIMIIVGLAMSQTDDSIHRSQQNGEDKREKEVIGLTNKPRNRIEEMGPQPPSEAKSPHFLPRLHTPFERIQYLTREHSHHPGPLDAGLGNDSPDAAIQRAVTMQWDNYTHHRPLDIRPSFSASPQAVYLGSRQRDDGQMVHDLVNLNSTQMIYNRTDGRPCVLTGHLFSHLVQTPSSASVIWPLEVPYPADSRIQEAMDFSASLGQYFDLPLRRDYSASPVLSATVENATMAVKETAVSQELTIPHGTYSSNQANPLFPTVSPEDATLQPETHSASELLGDADSNEPYSHLYGETVSDREPTPDSLPELEPQPLSPSSESDHGWIVTEPCPGCSGPQHRTINECPAWRLPSQSLESVLGMLAVCKVGNGALTWDPDENEVATAMNSTNTTPKVASLQLGFTPVIEPTLASTIGHSDPRETTILRNLQQILGLDPTGAENLSKLRDIARVAEMQAHEAYEIFSRRLAEEQEKLQNDSQGGGPPPAYVGQSIFTQSMTQSLLTNRPPFSLAMGVGVRGEQTSRNEEPNTYTATADPSVNINDPIESRVPANLPPGGSRPFIHDDSEDLPTPTLSELGDALTSLTSTSYGSPVTERSADFDFDEYDPQEIIDDAISRVIAGTPGIVAIHPPTSPLTSEPTAPSATLDGDDQGSDSSDQFYDAVTTNTGYSPKLQSTEFLDATLGQEVFGWVEHQMERENLTRRCDMNFGGEPWYNARDTAYGPLHPMLDFPRMAAENLRDLTRNVRTYTDLYGTLPPDPNRPLSPVSDTVPNPAQSATSLDFSLPHDDHQVTSTLPSLSEYIDVDALAEPEAGEDQGEKRKQTGSGASTAEQPRKRFPVRRGLLEGSQCVEDILVREKSDFCAARHEYYQENEWIHDTSANLQPRPIHGRFYHPLLFDFEAAKLQILYTLLRQHNYFELAWTLNDLLRLKFRDEYAIAHLLAASYLDFLAPTSPDFWDEYDSSRSSALSSSSMEGVESGHIDVASTSDGEVPGEAGIEAQETRVIPEPPASTASAPSLAYDSTTSSALSGSAEGMDTDSASPPRPLFRIRTDFLSRRRRARSEAVSAN
ncbi:hypothetical protein B0H17DRAFT_1126236 [Mycena rosella]|uniref:Uncharacterized protein n=1 Tax=Mycena rosella TaxID=1033263 RepID=A0AAD7GUB2_MYCRO|nr:hypothetical protein B0H17DRAFT_1126236 [Mycena rosella]